MESTTSGSRTHTRRRAASSSYHWVDAGEAVPRRPRTTVASTVLPILFLYSLMRSSTVRAQFSYIIENDGITITRYTGPGGVVTIPETIDGLPVTAIDDLVFTRYFNVTQVAIPAGVTNIADQAFANCWGLTDITVNELNPAFCSIDGVLFTRDQTTILNCPVEKTGDYTIPDSVIRVGDLAFTRCANLSKIEIPHGVIAIGRSAFASCMGLTEAIIPDNVTSLGNYAFSGCDNLRTVVLGNGLTRIGDSAFRGCSSLAGITIPTNVASIGERVFQGCTSLCTSKSPTASEASQRGHFQVASA